MKRIVLWTAIFCAGTVIGQARVVRADGQAPIKRIVLHGVACSDSGGDVCAKVHPVLDEAAEILNEEQDGSVAISFGPDPEMGTNQTGRNLKQPSADAVRDYLVAAGIAPELIDLR